MVAPAQDLLRWTYLAWPYLPPLTELLVEANNASGIRLLLPEPKYDNQSIELSDVWVIGNSLSPAAPLVRREVL